MVYILSSMTRWPAVILLEFPYHPVPERKKERKRKKVVTVENTWLVQPIMCFWVYRESPSVP